MSTPTMAGNDNEPSSKEEYMKLLDQILRTDLRSKAAAMLENAIGLKTEGYENGDENHHSRCSLTEAIKCTNHCISNLQRAGDSLLGSFISTSESYSKPRNRKSDPKVDFARVSRTMLNMITEAVTISRRIHENALGLHVATDFLRAPRDIEILNFSRSGRVPIQHYSCNEASTMGLTWLHSTASTWIKTLQDEDPKVSNECINTFSSLKDAILHLRDSSQFSSQVFRVLMYCNLEGKKLLREYIEKLTSDEVNDIITELQTLRRKFDQINILMEQLGWGLADIWTRFTGETVTFETLLRSSQDKLKPFGDVGDNDGVPEGVKNLKNKIKAGLQTFEKHPDPMAYVPLQQYKPSNRKAGKNCKAEQIRRESDFKTKLAEIFGTDKMSNTELEGRYRPTGANWSKPGCSPPTPQNLEANDRSIDPQVISDIHGGGDENAYDRAPLRAQSKGKSSFSRPMSCGSTPLLIGTGREDPETKTRNLILSNMFQEQLQGITQMMTEPQANAARASFHRFIRQHVGDASFDFFKRKFIAKKEAASLSSKSQTKN